VTAAVDAETTFAAGCVPWPQEFDSSCGSLLQKREIPKGRKSNGKWLGTKKMKSSAISLRGQVTARQDQK